MEHLTPIYKCRWVAKPPNFLPQPWDANHIPQLAKEPNLCESSAKWVNKKYKPIEMKHTELEAKDARRKSPKLWNTFLLGFYNNLPHIVKDKK